jgi:hypothetical protein
MFLPADFNKKPFWTQNRENFRNVLIFLKVFKNSKIKIRPKTSQDKN